MKIKVFILLFLFLLISCKPRIFEVSKKYSIIVDTILTDQISIRAILIDENKVWFASDKNRVGFYDLITNIKSEYTLAQDSLSLEFRSIAQTSESILVLSIANPAILFKINKKDFTVKLVYQENNEKVFYDSMQFWNNQEGIAVGDPTEDCFSIITTRDGGDSWQKMTCDKLPKLAEGEAFFAASNSNIVIKGSKTFIVSGGKKSRLYESKDQGFTWKVSETPIIQGEAMSGIFSADFYNEKIGFAVGGNYEKQSDNAANKIFTFDGGETWKIAAPNQSFGYASCVQFIPNTKGKQLITSGPSGVFYSEDQGSNWEKIISDNDLHTIRFQNDSTAFAAGKNKMIRIHFRKL